MTQKLSNNSHFLWLRLSALFSLCLASLSIIALSQVHAAPQEGSGASSTAEGRDVSHVPSSPAFSAQDLAAPPSENWLKVGGSLSNQNWSPLNQINRENVDKLKAVWQTHLDGSALATKYSGEAQPMIYEGVLYIVTGANDVFAISLKTGQILWKYQANLDQNINTVCRGWTSRGVATGAATSTSASWTDAWWRSIKKPAKRIG